MIAECLFHLSSIEKVIRATKIQQNISLFIATPISGGGVNDPDDVIGKYFALIRKYSDFFNNRAYLLCAEDLERRLPNKGVFSKLRNPALFVGKVDDSGDLTWVSVIAQGEA